MERSVVSLKLAQPYIRRYRGSTFVIKVGGGVLANESSKQSLSDQVSLLCDLGINIILVHGGGPQASTLSERLGIKPEMVGGRRITGDEVLDIALMTYAGKINTEFVSSLNTHYVKAVGLTGIDAFTISVNKRPPVEMVDDNGEKRLVDFGHVGDINSIDIDLLKSLLEKGFVPTIASICGNAEGSIFNVNADSVAEAIAVAISARKLIFVTEVNGLLQEVSDPNSLIPFADKSDLESLIDNGCIASGMRPKVEACIRATANGIKRSHIINGHMTDSLLFELFTGPGCGTMIVSKREKQAYQDEELD